MTTISKGSSLPHLGKGWSFPVRPVRGRLPWAEGDEHVAQAIGLVLETARKERSMRPEFGAGLQNHLFAGNSEATCRAIENDVRRALLEWEPRIRVESVRAFADPERDDVLRVEIDYRVLRNNAFYNRVFPFHLAESG